jgi:WhiB family redox-sensing transcriptional regulator
MMATERRDKGQVPAWGWQKQAACRDLDLDLFFGHDGERAAERAGREAKAKLVCASCPVREQCLDHALAMPERAGIWGGLNETERIAVQRRRHRTDAA